MQADARIDPESLERDNDRDIDSLADKTSFLRKVCARDEQNGLVLSHLDAYQRFCYFHGLRLQWMTLFTKCRSPVTSMQRSTRRTGSWTTWYGPCS